MQKMKGQTSVSYESFISLLDIPDFDMLITMAIGCQAYIHDDIASYYNQNKEYYYELFRNSPYYEDRRIKSLSVFNYRAVQQFIGLYLHEKSLGKNELTLTLIKKGFKLIYNFIKNRTVINLFKMRDTYADYLKKNAFGTTVHTAHRFGVALYLIKEWDKKIVYSESIINILQASIGQSFKSVEFGKLPANNKEVETFLSQYKPIGMEKKGSLFPLNDFLFQMDHFHIKDSEHAEYFTGVKHPFMKGILEMNTILQYGNINPIDLQNITPIDYQTLQDLTLLMRTCLDEGDTLGEQYRLLGSYLIIYSLVKDYNATKHNYLVTFHEETYRELHGLKEEYAQRIAVLRTEEEQKEKEITRLLEMNKILQASAADLEKQVVKKDKAIEELEKKLANLEVQNRQLEDSLKRKEQESAIPAVSLEELAAYINAHRFTVIGGSNVWQENMQKHLPNGRFMSHEELGADLEFLTRQDFIIYNEVHNRHAMFYKIKAVLESHDIPLIYAGANTNMELSLKNIHEQVQKYTKTKSQNFV